MIKLNAMGKACPLPVIETKKALKRNSVVETTVDNEIATENIKKMADKLGYSCQITAVDKNRYVIITSREGQNSLLQIDTAAEDSIPACTAPSSYIVVLSAACMGRGDDELGKSLIKSFVYSLTEQDVLPEKIICYNGGVKLAIKGADTLEDLKALAANGVKIFACGACLNFYGLTEELGVGEITNMYHIVEMMREASKIVRP